MRFCNQGTEFWDVRHVGFNVCKWLRVSLFIVNLLTVNELRMFRSVICPDLSAGGCFAKTMTSLVNYTIRVIGSGIKKSCYMKIVLRFIFSEL